MRRHRRAREHVPDPGLPQRPGRRDTLGGRPMTPHPHLTGSRRTTPETHGRLEVGGSTLSYHRVPPLAPDSMPVSRRILLENVLRFHDGSALADAQVQAVLSGDTDAPVDLYASRVFLHDTNGVPTVVDLAAMR